MRKVLKEAGIPEPAEPLDLVGVAYSLAASMIVADKKILPEEVALASEIGSRILDGFDDGEFRKTVDNHEQLPEPAELAGLLRDVLTDEGKVLVYRYLLAIAHADQDSADEGVALATVMDKLGLAPPEGRKVVPPMTKGRRRHERWRAWPFSRAVWGLPGHGYGPER